MTGQTCQHGSNTMGCLWCSAAGPQHPIHERVRQLEADLALAQKAASEAERLRVEVFDQVHEIQQESEARLNRAEASERALATVRAEAAALWQDVSEWVRLAKRQRAEWAGTHGADHDALCPTEAGIQKSERLLRPWNHDATYPKTRHGDTVCFKVPNAINALAKESR